MYRTALSLAVLSFLLSGVPAHASQAKTAPGAPAKPSPTTIVNLNTASATDLEELPGIGAKTAARIVEYRQKNGPFKKVEELMNVRGVGEKSFLKLKPQLTIAPAKVDHEHPNLP
jgi:competence protein ComEA